MGEICVSKAVDEKGDGLDFRKLWRWELGVHLRFTDDSETFRLDNLESEVAGGEYGAPDRYL